MRKRKGEGVGKLGDTMKQGEFEKGVKGTSVRDQKCYRDWRNSASVLLGWRQKLTVLNQTQGHIFRLVGSTVYLFFFFFLFAFFMDTVIFVPLKFD